jgi:plasmid rolling circle replication initiator protein Rep
MGVYVKKDELDDRSATGRKRPWKQHKGNNERVVKALRILQYNDKAHKILECGRTLIFGVCPDGHGQWLKKALFCKDRVCFICIWRKSLFVYHQFRQVAHEVLKSNPNVVFLFLTLTVANCKPECLNDAVTHMHQSFQRFNRLPEIKKVFLGHFKTLEITYNPLYNTFHPHIHCIVAVNRSYFQGSCYLNQPIITVLWKKALKVDYDPVCDIRRVKAKKNGIPTDIEEIRSMDAALIQSYLAGAAAEVAKYAAKVADILFPKANRSDSFAMKEAKAKLRADPQRQAKILDHLITALHHRRLVSYTGIFKKAYQALKCTDVEQSDLILMPGEEKKCTCPICQSELVYLHYLWNGKGYFLK